MPGGPTNLIDAMRCDLDEVSAVCHEAHDMLRAIITRQAQRARTIPEAEDVVALIELRACLYHIQEAANAHHPDRRDGPK